MDLELTSCPACGHPAEIYDRFVVVADRGAVEHVKIRCITGATFERAVGPWTPGSRPKRSTDAQRRRA
jgi:hypothetical protein